MLEKVVKRKTPYIVDGIPFALFAFRYVQLPLLAPGGGEQQVALAMPLTSSQGLHHKRLPVAQSKPPAAPPYAGEKLHTLHTANSALEFLMNDQLNLGVL